MIKNTSELKSVQQELEKFRAALKTLEAEQKDIDPILLKMQKDSIQSFIDEFEKEILEYETLKNGDACFVYIDDNKLNEVIIKTRIALGLSQADLAEKIGTTQQQIQRWESCNYESISWAKMRNILDALGIHLPPHNLIVKQPQFLRPKGMEDKTINNAQGKVKEWGTLLRCGIN